MRKPRNAGTFNQEIPEGGIPLKTDDLPLGDLEEPPGTILIGSATKRAYLFLSQTRQRMAAERAHAAKSGVQDMRDFVFVLDGERIELSYDELVARLCLRPKPNP